jgi:hypothetical protein
MYEKTGGVRFQSSYEPNMFYHCSPRWVGVYHVTDKDELECKRFIYPVGKNGDICMTGLCFEDRVISYMLLDAVAPVNFAFCGCRQPLSCHTSEETREVLLRLPHVHKVECPYRILV